MASLILLFSFLRFKMSTLDNQQSTTNREVVLNVIITILYGGSRIGVRLQFT
jgi:hypothetical protein